MESELVEAIHHSPWKGCFAITGGGSGAILELQKRGGSSATILEATVPYATESFVDYVKGKVDKFCSSEGARALAMAAFQRAITLTNCEDDAQYLFGIGVSCSLAKGLAKDERINRENHLWIAVQTCDKTGVAHYDLPLADREVQDQDCPPSP